MLERVAQLKRDYRFEFTSCSQPRAGRVDGYPILRPRRSSLSFRMGLEEQYGDAAEKVREHTASSSGSCPWSRLATACSFAQLPNTSIIAASIARCSAPYQPADLREHGDVFERSGGATIGPIMHNAFARGRSAVLVHGHEPCRRGSRPERHAIDRRLRGEIACYVMLRSIGRSRMPRAVASVRRLG